MRWRKGSASKAEGESERAMHQRDINKVRWQKNSGMTVVIKLTDSVYTSGLQATAKPCRLCIPCIQIYVLRFRPRTLNTERLFYFRIENPLGENARDNLPGLRDSLLFEHSVRERLLREQKRHQHFPRALTHDRSRPTFPRKVERIVRSVLISRERSSHRGLVA